MSKSLFKNSLFNILYRGFNVLYPMVTSAYISRIFHADGVGLIMFAINIVTYFSIAASLGIPNYAVRVISASRTNKTLTSRKFSELSIILAISSIFFSICYYATVPLVLNKNDLLIPGFVLGLIVITNIFNYDWLFEAFEDFEYLAVRSITVKCFLLVCMFLLVKSRDDLVLYCGIYAFIYVFNNLWNAISFRKHAQMVLKNIDATPHLKPILILFAAAFATEIYTLLDSTMLGVMCQPDSLGYYSNASKVVRALYGVLFAVVAVFNPRLSYYFGSGQMDSYNLYFRSYFDIGTLISFPSFVLLLTCSSSIIHVLFGEGFEPAVFILQILSPLVIIFMLATIFGHIPLVIYGKEKKLLFATIVGAILNFCLNQLLIPYYYHNGAAFASLFSEIIVTLIMMYYSLRVVNTKSFKSSNFFSTLFSTIVMGLAIVAISSLDFDAHYLVFLQSIIGILIYISTLYLTHNTIIRDVVLKIQRC